MKHFSKALIAGMVCLFSVALALLALATWIIAAPPTLWRPTLGQTRITPFVSEDGGFLFEIPYEGTPLTVGTTTDKEVPTLYARLAAALHFKKEDGTEVNLTLGDDYSLSFGIDGLTLDDGKTRHTYYKSGENHAEERIDGCTYTLSNFAVQLARTAQKNYTLGGNNYEIKNAVVKYQTAYWKENEENDGTMSEGKWYEGVKWFTLEDALQAAEASSNPATVVLAGDPHTGETAKTNTVPLRTRFTSLVLENGKYQKPTAGALSAPAIPKNVTLLVPYGAADTGASAFNTDTEERSGFYSELVLDRGLNVEGTLTVNGVRHLEGGGASGYVDKSHSYAAVDLEGGTMSVTGTLNAMSFVHGSGEIEAKSGANIYEPLVLTGWKGGEISALRLLSMMFPLNQYTVPTISCPLTLHHGATYFVDIAVILLRNIVIEAPTEFLSSTAGESFLCTSPRSTVMKTVDPDTGKTTFETNGEIELYNLTLPINGAALGVPGFTLSFSTEWRQIPIPGNFAIHVKSGTLTVPEDIQIKLLPGATLKVEEGATLNINGKLFAYGFDSGNGVTNVTKMDTGTATGTVKDGMRPEVDFHEDRGVLSAWTDGTKSYPEGQSLGFFATLTNRQEYDGTTPAVVQIAGTMKVSGILAAVVTGDGNGKPSLDLIQADEISTQDERDCVFEDWKTNGSDKSNYIFRTSLSRIGANGEALKAGHKYSFDEYGRWLQDEISYTLRFNVKIGEGTINSSSSPWSTNEMTIAGGEMITLTYDKIEDFLSDVAVKRPGYKIAGWYLGNNEDDLFTENNGKEFSVRADRDDMIIDLWAKWESVSETVNVTFVFVDEDNKETSISYDCAMGSTLKDILTDFSTNMDSDSSNDDPLTAKYYENFDVTEEYAWDDWQLSDGTPIDIAEYTLDENHNGVIIKTRRSKKATLQVWLEQIAGKPQVGAVYYNTLTLTVELEGNLHSTPTIKLNNHANVYLWAKREWSLTFKGKLTIANKFPKLTSGIAQIVFTGNSDETYSVTVYRTNKTSGEPIIPESVLDKGNGSFADGNTYRFVGTFGSCMNNATWHNGEKEAMFAYHWSHELVQITGDKDGYEHGGGHVDIDNDLHCDLCHYFMGLGSRRWQDADGWVYKLNADGTDAEIVSWHYDNDGDGLCDFCSYYNPPIKTCTVDHVDADVDGFCDRCGCSLSASPALASLASALPALPALPASLSSPSSSSLPLRRKFL